MCGSLVVWDYDLWLLRGICLSLSTLLPGPMTWLSTYVIVVMGWAFCLLYPIHCTQPCSCPSLPWLDGQYCCLWEVVEQLLGIIKVTLPFSLEFGFCFVWFSLSCTSFNCHFSNCNSRSIFSLTSFAILFMHSLWYWITCAFQSVYDIFIKPGITSALILTSEGSPANIPCGNIIDIGPCHFGFLDLEFYLSTVLQFSSKPLLALLAFFRSIVENLWLLTSTGNSDLHTSLQATQLANGSSSFSQPVHLTPYYLTWRVRMLLWL